MLKKDEKYFITAIAEKIKESAKEYNVSNNIKKLQLTDARKLNSIFQLFANNVEETFTHIITTRQIIFA